MKSKWIRSAFVLTLALLLARGASAGYAASPDTHGITYIGEFSNVRHTTDHAYGYAVQLWRDGDRFFGLLAVSDGLAGDTPVGLLDNAQFDPTKRTLTFSSKLSVGVIYLGQGRQEHTHDMFSFDGTLEDEKFLSGTLTHTDQLQAARNPEIKRVRLVRTDGESPIEAVSYEQWRKAVQPILKARGPKW